MTEDNFYFVSGQCEPWPSKRQMAEILEKGGLRIYVGLYSIRIEDFDHFVFQQYGGDLGEPRLDADSEDIQRLRQETRTVSDLLTLAGFRHRFEIYSPDDELVEYLHHNWPQ